VAPGDRDDLLTGIGRIVATSFVPGTQASLEIKGEFLPLVQSALSKRVFEHYVACAAEVGIAVGGEFTGGCADSGFVAAAGAPVLCGMGPVGGKAHSPDEFLNLDSLTQRAQACARAILRLEQAGL
jgi:glutamate carboxypeptidase